MYINVSVTFVSKKMVQMYHSLIFMITFLFLPAIKLTEEDVLPGAKLQLSTTYGYRGLSTST